MLAHLATVLGAEVGRSLAESSTKLSTPNGRRPRRFRRRGACKYVSFGMIVVQRLQLVVNSQFWREGDQGPLDLIVR